MSTFPLLSGQHGLAGRGHALLALALFSALAVGLARWWASTDPAVTPTREVETLTRLEVMQALRASERGAGRALRAIQHPVALAVLPHGPTLRLELFLLEFRAELRRRDGDFEGALDDLAGCTFVFVDDSHDVRRLALTAACWIGLGDWPEAESSLRLALEVQEELGGADPRSLRRMLDARLAAGRSGASDSEVVGIGASALRQRARAWFSELEADWDRALPGRDPASR